MLCLLDWSSNPGAALTIEANREAKMKPAVSILAFLQAPRGVRVQKKVDAEIYICFSNSSSELATVVSSDGF